MICKTFCNEFPGCNLCYLNITWDKRDSIRNSYMCHLIDTKEIWCQRGTYKTLEKKPFSRSTVPCPLVMMVESSPKWMGMDLLVSKDEKESFSSIKWFKSLDSINSDLDFKVLSMRAWPFSCCGSRSYWSLLRNLFERLMWFLSRREVASSSFFFMKACSW